ncbi:MAG: WG repeat-containing protein [Bacteroidota bacterium]
MKKWMVLGWFFLPFTLAAQPAYEIFRENGKAGVKNDKGEVKIQPDYKDILVYDYYSKPADSLVRTLFIGVREGAISERMYNDSTAYYKDEYTISGTVRKIRYKTVQGAKLDIFNYSFKPIAEGAEDFAYLTVSDEYPYASPGFYYYAISGEFTLGNYGFSFQYIDNTYPSLYKKNGKWGMINKDEGKISGDLHDSIKRNFAPGEFFIYKKGKTGIALADGSVVVDPVYDEVVYPGLFTSSDFYIVRRNSKFGVVKWGNKVIVPVEYNSVIPVNEKYIIVNKEGVIKTKNERVKMPSYEYDVYMNPPEEVYFDFKDSLIVGGKFGLFDSKGNTVIPEKYDYISVTGDVFRVVKGGKENTEIYTGSQGEYYYTYYANEPGTTYQYSHYQHHENVAGGKRSYIDASGKKVFKGVDSVGMMQFNTDYGYSLYTVPKEKFYYLQKGEKSGMADSLRKIIVPVKYTSVAPLSAKYGDSTFNYFKVGINEMEGLYDQKGKELLPSKFNFITLASTSAFGYMNYYYYNYYDYENKPDTSLKEEKPVQSVFITGEGGKLQKVKEMATDEFFGFESDYEILKDVKYSLYNLRGEKITREFFDTLLFNYGSDLISAKKLGRWGLINMDGNYIARCDYDQLFFQGNGRFVVYKDNVCGLISAEGLLIPVEYDAISALGGDLFKVTRGYQNGIFSLSKGMIIPVEYDYLYKDYYSEYIMLTQNERYGMSDGNGTILLPCVYDGLELIAYGFGRNITKIMEGDMIGFYDKEKREIILEPSVSWIEDAFGDRYMKIKNGGEAIRNEYGDVIDFTGGKNGIIDSSARIIVPPVYDQVSSFNSEVGLFRATNSGQVADYFDSLGKKVTNGDQLWANSFIARLAKKKPAAEIKVSSASGPFGCDATSFYADKDGNYWLGTGSSGGVYFSSDKGKTWEPRLNGTGPVHAYLLTEMNDTIFMLANQYNETGYDYYYIDEILQMFYYDVIAKQWMPYSSTEMNEMGEMPFFYDLERVKQSKYQSDTLGMQRAGKIITSGASYLEEYYNNEGYHDPYDQYYNVNMEYLLSEKENGADTIRKNFPPDVYSIYGGEIIYGNNEQFLLAKSGAYRLDINENIQKLGEEGLLASDVSQSLTLGDGRIMVKEGSSDIWQWHNGRWTCVFDFYEQFKNKGEDKMRNVKTGYLSADKNDNLYFCSGGTLFMLDRLGNLKTLMSSDTLSQLFSGGTMEVNEYGNILDTAYYRYKPLQAARNEKGELCVLGTLQDISFLYEYSNYYALAVLDEKTGKISFPYGIFDQPTFEPFIKTDKKGGVYMFTQRTVFKAGDTTFKRETNYLNEYTVLKYNTTAVSPEGDIIITDYPDKLKYYESKSKQWHTLKINDKRVQLSAVGFDASGNILGATGFVYTFYCGGPGEMTGEAGVYRAKFTDMGIEWEKVKNEINSKIISIEPNSQFGVLLGSSGSGLLIGK